MAKTETTATREEVEAAFEELKAAGKVYLDAVDKFMRVFDCDTVSAEGLYEHLEGVENDIQENIDSTFEEDEDEE